MVEIMVQELCGCGDNEMIQVGGTRRVRVSYDAMRDLIASTGLTIVYDVPAGPEHGREFEYISTSGQYVCVSQ